MDNGPFGDRAAIFNSVVSNNYQWMLRELIQTNLAASIPLKLFETKVAAVWLKRSIENRALSYGYGLFKDLS